MSRGALLVVAVLAVACVALAKEDGRGWGDNIEWRTFADGLAESRSSGRPMMAIFHKSWCGACKNLKSNVNGNADFAALSANFVMVNIMDEPEADKKEHQPDGGYIPRVLFFDPATGEPRTDLYNKAGNPQYKFYYNSPAALLDGMRDALKAFSSPAPAAADAADKPTTHEL
eukprot:m51a1_g737 hypothetical protein (172) ;mRNA; f:491384-492018